MFTHSEVQVASAVAIGLKVSGSIELQARAVGPGQIGGADDQPGNILGDCVQYISRTLASGKAFCVSRKCWQVFVPAFRQFSLLHGVDLLCEIRIFLAVVSEKRFPLFPRLTAALADSVFEIVEYAVRDQELCVLGP